MCFLMIVVLMFPTGIMAADKDDDQDDKDKNTTIDEIVNEVPIDKEITGKVFGSIFYTKDDDIDIDVNPGGDDNNNNNNNNNNSNNNNNNNNGNNNNSNNNNSNNNGSNGQWNQNVNIPDSNQNDYGIGNDGTDQKDSKIVYYKWEKAIQKLTIYPALFEKATKEKKNIVMRVIDEKDKSLEYRIRILYDDFKDVKVDDLKIELGHKCTHKDKISELLLSVEARALFQCKQEALPVDVYIGVGVPESWDHSYGVYQYEYLEKDNSLKLIRKDLQIDEQNVVEVKMTPNKDYVFYSHVLPKEEHNLLTWISGLSGHSQIVDQGNAWKSFAMFFAGVMLIGGVIYVILDEKRKKLKTTILEVEDTEVVDPEDEANGE